MVYFSIEMWGTSLLIYTKKEYSERIEALFDEIGAEKWDNEYFTITKTKSYTKESFDSKTFKQDHPETYAEYVKKTTVKGSIKTVLKSE